MVGPTIVAIFSFGVHPSGMKNAVIRPQAMIAAMFGMIIMDRKVPNFCTWTRKLVPEPPDVVGVVAIEAMCLPLVVPDVTPVTPALPPVCNTLGHIATHPGANICPLVWLFLHCTTSVAGGPPPVSTPPKGTPGHEGTALLRSRGRPARGRE